MTQSNTGPATSSLKMNRQQRRRQNRVTRQNNVRRGTTSGVDKAITKALNQALAFQKAGRPQEALQAYRQILVTHPKHANALNFAGVAAYQTGAVDEAVELLKGAVSVAPVYAEAHMNLGNVLQAAGQLTEAAAAYRRAIEIEPSNARAYYNLGILLQVSGDPVGAITAYRTAVEIRPDYGEAYHNLGAVLEGFGELKEAVAACRRAVQLKPNDPSAHNNLGIALRAGGEREQAVRALERAIEIAPNYGKAHYNLAQLLYCDTDPEPTAQALARALDSDGDLAMAHFYLGVIRDQQGKHESANAHFERLADHPGDSCHLADSWHYVKCVQSPSTRYHGDTFETLRFGLDQAGVDGLVLEFGVRFGNSINFIAKNVDREVHGFDSFQGLPEAWEYHQAGAYTTGGRLPEVAQNVRLHVGLFADTLPGFLTEHPGPIRFMNVDCDLYSSTKTVLESCADQIIPGTVIVFDEYLINPQWRDHEFRAFQEALAANSWNYEYLAFNLFSKQAAVRIL